MDDAESYGIRSLTPRERRLVLAVCQAMSDSEIAEELLISETEVRDLLALILRKLDVFDRFELALYAYTHRSACTGLLSRAARKQNQPPVTENTKNAES